MSKNRPFIHQEERKGDATLTFLPQPESSPGSTSTMQENATALRPELFPTAPRPWTAFLLYLREMMAVPASEPSRIARGQNEMKVACVFFF